MLLYNTNYNCLIFSLTKSAYNIQRSDVNNPKKNCVYFAQRTVELVLLTLKFLWHVPTSSNFQVSLTQVYWVFASSRLSRTLRRWTENIMVGYINVLYWHMMNKTQRGFCLELSCPSTLPKNDKVTYLEWCTS